MFNLSQTAQTPLLVFNASAMRVFNNKFEAVGTRELISLMSLRCELLHILNPNLKTRNPWIMCPYSLHLAMTLAPAVEEFGLKFEAFAE